MLNKAQKFYVDQNRSKLSLEQLAIDLEVGLDQIEEYLQTEIERLQQSKSINEQKKNLGAVIMTPQLAELYDVVGKPTKRVMAEHVTTTKRS